MTLTDIKVLLFSCIAFISCNQVAAAEREAVSEGAASIQILNLCIFPSGKIVLKCQNNGNKPVKAFKGQWVVFDDFNEASQSGDILFTSNTAVMGSNALLGGYLIQPNSTIYLANDEYQRIALVGRAADELGQLEKLPPTWKKRFKAAITNVIFAEQEDVDNLRKQEDALREQERLRQQEIMRRAEDDASEAERKRRFDQMITQSQTATREIARIPMEDSREHFIVTDVSVEYRGARKDFRRLPNLQAGGSRAIVEDGTYSYFATQADRDKALRIFNEAIKAWQKKFPEGADALDVSATPPREPQDSPAASPPSNTKTMSPPPMLARTESAFPEAHPSAEPVDLYRAFFEAHFDKISRKDLPGVLADYADQVTYFGSRVDKAHIQKDEIKDFETSHIIMESVVDVRRISPNELEFDVLTTNARSRGNQWTTKRVRNTLKLIPSGSSFKIIEQAAKVLSTSNEPPFETQ